MGATCLLDVTQNEIMYVTKGRVCTKSALRKIEATPPFNQSESKGESRNPSKQSYSIMLCCNVMTTETSKIDRGINSDYL